jgi:hypothetical protein
LIYRAYVLNIEGRVLEYHEFDCEADEEAVRLASELIGDAPVEVWLGLRRIARLTADDRS